MRGISTIIAIILILMIVVALAALTWTWFNTIFASLTASAESAVEGTTTTMGTDFTIENAKYLDSTVNATIRNTGTQNFNVSKSSAYIDGDYYSIDFDPGDILTPGDTSIIFHQNTTEIPGVCGAVLKIVIETGLLKTTTIAC